MLQVLDLTTPETEDKEVHVTKPTKQRLGLGDKTQQSLHVCLTASD